MYSVTYFSLKILYLYKKKKSHHNNTVVMSIFIKIIIELQ